MTQLTAEQAQLFSRYEELKANEAKLKNEINTVKEQIIPLIPEGATIPGNNGKFDVRSRASYKYSPNVKRMEDEVKEAKADEVRTGTAEETLSHSLYYTVNKEEEK